MTIGNLNTPQTPIISLSMATRLGICPLLQLVPNLSVFQFNFLNFLHSRAIPLPKKSQQK